MKNLVKKKIRLKNIPWVTPNDQFLKSNPVRNKLIAFQINVTPNYSVGTNMR